MVIAEVPGGVERLTRDMPLLAEFPTCQVMQPVLLFLQNIV